MKKKSALIILICIAAVFSAASAVFTGCRADNAVKSAALPFLSFSSFRAEPTLSRKPLKPIIEEIKWKGWQSARSAENTVLYAQKDSEAEAVYEIPSGTDCVITEQDNDRVYVRSLRYAGWASAGSLTATGT